jgi:hypothetical protein
LAFERHPALSIGCSCKNVSRHQIYRIENTQPAFDEIVEHLQRLLFGDISARAVASRSDISKTSLMPVMIPAKSLHEIIVPDVLLSTDARVERVIDRVCVDC